MGNALRRLAPLAIVGCLLAFAIAVASMSTPGVHRVPLPLQSESATVSVSPSPGGSATFEPTHARGDGHGLVMPTWIQPVLMAIGGLVVVALVGFVLWRLIANAVETRDVRRSRRARPAPITRREAVLAVVDASIADLARDDGDPRSAVIICWVRLEEVATVAGVPREPGDVPADLVRGLLGAHQVSVGVLDTLADLYRAARFSPGDVGPAMRDEARRSFLRLRDELSGAARVAAGAASDGQTGGGSAPEAGPGAPRPRPRPSSPPHETDREARR